jgi:uncharacterized protein YqhQ
MGPTTALQRLARADATASLPRLGGMARPDGVVIVSERFWAFAGIDGSVREGEMPRAQGRLARLPFMRGLVRLGASLSPLFRSTGVARGRERIVLALAVVAPLGLVFAPPAVGLWGGVAITLLLIGWLFRGRALRLHGAEHRAIAAAEERRLAPTWEGLVRPSRFAPRCGTNFAALAVPTTVLADRLWPVPATFYTPILVTVLSLALTMELWRLVQSAQGWRRLFLAPGLALQRLTTREPALEDTRLALVAVASVLDRELTHST